MRVYLYRSHIFGPCAVQSTQGRTKWRNCYWSLTIHTLGGPRISWFLVLWGNHEMQGLWIPGTSFSVKPQNASKIFQTSTFWAFFHGILMLFPHWNSIFKSTVTLDSGINVGSTFINCEFFPGPTALSIIGKNIFFRFFITSNVCTHFPCSTSISESKVYAYWISYLYL